MKRTVLLVRAIILLIHCIIPLYVAKSLRFSPSDLSPGLRHEKIQSEIAFLENVAQFTRQASQKYGSENDVYRMDKSLTCYFCRGSVTLLQSLVRQGKTKDEIAQLAGVICVKLKIEDERVCLAVVQEFKEEVVEVFARLVLSADDVCGLILGPNCGNVPDPDAMWNVTYPDTPKPPVRPPTWPKAGSPTLRVLHLSDIHVDLQYSPGSNAECGEPLCCRGGGGLPKGAPAGKWGDYRNCDLPLPTLENLFQHLATKEKFDYIIWTGDLPPHNIWNQSRSDQLLVQQILDKLFAKYLPGIPVYPAMGNHESAPVNSFPPPFITGYDSMAWLYTKLSESWTKWLPNTTVPDISRGGYYTALVQPGFRIVSLNMNYCNNENWWLLLNTTDPAQELQWLIGVLQHAEDHQEKVHILGHIPPGSGDCLKAWSWNYYNIINRANSDLSYSITAELNANPYMKQLRLAAGRPALAFAYAAPITDLTGDYAGVFSTSGAVGMGGQLIDSVMIMKAGRYENTVVAQFFGHTHKDSYMMFYDNATFTRPLGVAYIGPSVTTYSFINPGYRIYTVDGNYHNSSRLVLDHETYILNLTEANRSDQPMWTPEYSAKEAYGMSSLLPKDWDNLIQQMATNQTLFDLYYRYYYKSEPQGESCDRSCRIEMLCTIKAGRSYDSHLSHCMENHSNKYLKMHGPLIGQA